MDLFNFDHTSAPCNLKTASTWRGFPTKTGTLLGYPLTVVTPPNPKPGRPWIWKTEFLDAFANAEEALIKEGFHLVYLEVLDHYGSPKAVSYGDTLYHLMVEQLKLSPKVCLLGMSRGGLWAYNWAIKNPDKVALIVGDNPVTDFKSWPAGFGSGPGSAEDWEKCLKIYGLTEDEAKAWPGNPVDNLSPLVQADIPILHVIGDADEVVPIAENSDVVKSRYQSLGGRYEEIVKPGGLHHPHGLPNDPTPLVEFYLMHWRSS